MRAYRKTATHHQYCVYLTTEERERLLEELRRTVDPSFWPALSRLYAHLNAPRGENE
ncbi:hypothetical protein [Streptomyces sp. ATexAB-D23]|uniref:hypothetical protein n=1 Tax=unclassified Streptomyces TaxID=2593676 RepID=UPI00037D3221|nr:hypothetical protein [Streptomyces sp. ATexAB-D23]